MKKILFVCLGNICRSPAAEGVFKAKLTEQGLESDYVVDSAGTSGWHIGERADGRMIKSAAQRNYDLQSRSRKVLDSDFDEFELIIAMDRSNVRNLQKMGGGRKHRANCFLMTDFCQKYKGVEEVPDPYYDGEEGFSHVLDLLEDACDELIKRLEAKEL
ncbi:putative low molecular weight protein-tyrosine-phosphatase [Lentisphaera araneosa HTCC2155]|uniref:Putative low molecular weight protein-tyrosine-phosphatase n=1 Tax=Lentisphaera araneosa HTCC2155 TaxID=313628 RepID=A6DKW6_9BACT|nr:low molecular weight protein-tyrosine-phosphatase [Lentisphaera araneosa]EDM27568.1 putative low molecular weight protein-tyrosine-phosphatase [Lentisphaera araneosa HTCC2155]